MSQFEINNCPICGTPSVTAYCDKCEHYTMLDLEWCE